ncbi:MAG: terminase [Caldilineaceae bacterium]
MTTVAEARELLRYLTPEEREEIDALLADDMAQHVWRAVPGPQQMAYDSEADIVGYGGSAGGGKTDLIAGLTQRHKRCLVARREKAQTEGFVQRLSELMGGTDGLNSQKGIWWLPRPQGTLVELAGLDNPGDEKRWQGRAHDLKAFDEVTEMRESQVRFVMGWTRTNDPRIKPKVLMTFNPPNDVEGRWVIDFFGPWLDKKHKLYPTLPGKLRWCAMLPNADGKYIDQWVDSGKPFVLGPGNERVYEFDASKYTPEQIIQPKSRTFIPARLTDNPYYMATNYMSTLQSLPEPLRSRLLYGDFQAGIEDSEWQVIPTLWVEAAQARWHVRSPKGEQMALGVDVARGGKDRTTIAPRYRTVDGATDYYFDGLKSWPGTETPNGPTVAGYTIAARRDDAPIHVDVIGVGAAVYDVLDQMGLPVYGINVAEKSNDTDKSGRLTFFNQRSFLVWRLRELLDPAADNGIALPPDPELLRELCAFKWEVSGFRVKVSSREELFDDLGLSVDKAWAVILATFDTPKIGRIKRALAQGMVLSYDPMDHDPLA